MVCILRCMNIHLQQHGPVASALHAQVAFYTVYYVSKHPFEASVALGLGKSDGQPAGAARGTADDSTAHARGQLAKGHMHLATFWPSGEV